MEPTRIQIQRNFRYLALLLAALLLVEALWPERVWMMPVAALGAVWLLDWVWARSLARGLRLTRESRFGWAQVGDQLEERFTLSKQGQLPALWVEITDGSNLPDYRASMATGINGEAENTWRVEHACAQRGVYHLGPTTVQSGTPFGIYTVRLEYEAQSPLLVMPPVVALPEIKVAPGGRAKEGRLRASAFEQTVSAAGVREYRPGDPFRAVHWRSVAHRDDWMVRTFESTPAGDWWIWLDLDAQEQAGQGENSTVEHAVILAASLAERGLRTGHAVGLTVNGRPPVWLTPQGSEVQRLLILRALATVEPGERTLAEQLGRMRQPTPQTASVIVITPAVEGQWLDALLAYKNRAVTPTVLLLDRATYGDTATTERTAALLAEWEIPYFIIGRDVLARQEIRPGRKGHWNWAVNATGRAVARIAARDEGWSVLA